MVSWLATVKTGSVIVEATGDARKAKGPAALSRRAPV
jgi:hypothetical protein